MRPDAMCDNIISRVTKKKKIGKLVEPMFRPRPKTDAFRLQPYATEGLPEKAYICSTGQ